MNRLSNLSIRKVVGFSLLELLIAVGIIGILAAIVYPRYQDMVIRSHRADATTLLMDAAQSLERCYTRFYAYDDNRCTASPVGRVSEGGFYRITDDSDIEETSFRLVAVPQGRQENDTECGNFTLDHRSARGVSGSGSADNCW